MKKTRVSTKFRTNPPQPHAKTVKVPGEGEEAGVPTVTAVENGAAEEAVEDKEASAEVMGTSPTVLRHHTLGTRLDSTPWDNDGIVEKTATPGTIAM